MKSIATAILAAILLATTGCSSLTGSGTTSTPTATSILTTKVDMVAVSKAAYVARAGYFAYLTVANKVKDQVPVCAAVSPAPICITAEQMALLKATERSTADLTLAGVTGVQAVGANPTAIAAAVVLAEAAVTSFKTQTDIWKDKVKS